MSSFHKGHRQHADRCLPELEWLLNSQRNERIYMGRLRGVVHTETLSYAKLVA